MTIYAKPRRQFWLAKNLFTFFFFKYWLWDVYGNFDFLAIFSFIQSNRRGAWAFQSFFMVLKLSKPNTRTYEHFLKYYGTPEAYSEPYQTSKMDRFTEIVISISPFTAFANGSLLDIWCSSEYATGFCP